MTTPTSTAARSARLLGIALLGVPLAAFPSGCVDANNRSNIGHAPAPEVYLESLTNAQPLASYDGATPDESAFDRPDDLPSLTSIDRSTWAQTSMVIPVDYTLHRPHYRIPWTGTDKIARERNEHPTPESALELQCRSANQQALEAAVAPFFALVEGVAIPFRLITEPQCLTWRSPQEPYQRTATKPTPAQADEAAKADVPEPDPQPQPEPQPEQQPQ